MKKLIWKVSSINILYKFLKKELIKITNLHEKFIVLIQLMIIFFDEIIFDAITCFKFSINISEKNYKKFNGPRPTLKKQIVDFTKYLKKNFQDLENICFLDIGCGFGKVIYFMKNLNFKKIYGIEIDNYVYRKVKNTFSHNKSISIYNENFFDYQIPKNIKFFFLFSPFRYNQDYLKLINILIKYSKKNNIKIYVLLSNKRSKEFFLSKKFKLEFTKSYLGKSYNSFIVSYEALN